MPWYAEKIGPLPVGMWAAVLAGGLAIGYVTRSRSKSDVPMIETGGDTGTGDTQAPLQTTGFGTLIPATPTIVSNTFVTNEEWVTAALNAMETADPVLDAAAAEAALNAYISGSVLTASQQAYVTLAVALIGRPPIPIQVVVPTPTPTPPPPPAPSRTVTTWRGHRMRRTRKLRYVAQYYAGNPSNATSVESTLRAILRVNPWIRNTSAWKRSQSVNAGWIIIVPVQSGRTYGGDPP